MGLRNLFRAWFLLNTDTMQLLKGDFAPTSTVEEVKANYAQHTALGMQKTILQFLHGEADKISANIVLFNSHSLDSNVESTIATLKEWTKRDPVWKRPPILSFWVGDAHVEMTDCMIESLGNITYGQPSFFGGVRHVTLTLNLLKYESYTIKEKGIYETRYARVKQNDYYEMLCTREYGSPLMGDVIRHRHATNLNPQIGDIVKLPSIEAIRKETVEPKSVVLKTAFDKADSPQRTLRMDMFERRNKSYVSHVIVEG
jgi:hypothetical protein